MPWFQDPLHSFLVAVNKNAGDDVAMALDYRADPSDPRVVATDSWTNAADCEWRIVAPSLSTFIGETAI
jgi:hypothetical protein